MCDLSIARKEGPVTHISHLRKLRLRMEKSLTRVLRGWAHSAHAQGCTYIRALEMSPFLCPPRDPASGQARPFLPGEASKSPDVLCQAALNLHQARGATRTAGPCLPRSRVYGDHPVSEGEEPNPPLTSYPTASCPHPSILSPGPSLPRRHASTPPPQTALHAATPTRQ